MNKLKYAGLNGCWKVVWPEAVTCTLERYQAAGLNQEYRNLSLEV